MKVNLSEVKAGYTAIKKLASKEYEKGEFDDSLHLIDQASVIASQIMWRYDDRELDLLHTKIAEKVIKNQVSEFKPQKNKIVFLDYFGSTFILAIQYIKALSKLNYDILYIYENQERGLNVPVIDIMNKYPNVTVKTIPFNISKSKSINEIYDSIVAYNPEKLFLHINTLSNVLPVIHVLPKSITKYYINLGDHAYWLGSSSIDYSFEFRSFGAVVSKEKRGISNEKILHLPYYPIINGFEFQGFPEKVENKVKIFSGGDFYKMVDSKNSYWDLVKKLLDENEDAVIIFANKIINKQGQKFLDKFIKENKFENRFFPVGFRKDINEVFRHSDIFMGSFPMSGGLMSQYAAFNSKPILQYYPKELFAFEETESVICFNDNIQISFTDKSRVKKLNHV